MKRSGLDGCLLSFVLLGIASFFGWLTHIIHCFKYGEWGFLIAGAIAAPIGVIHGWLIWLGIA